MWSDDEDGAEGEAADADADADDDDADLVAETEEKEKADEEAGSFPKEMDLLGSLGASDGLVDPNSSREAGKFADQILKDVGLHIQANIDAEEANKSPAEKTGEELRTTWDKEFGFVWDVFPCNFWNFKLTVIIWTLNEFNRFCTSSAWVLECLLKIHKSRDSHVKPVSNNNEFICRAAIDDYLNRLSSSNRYIELLSSNVLIVINPCRAAETLSCQAAATHTKS